MNILITGATGFVGQNLSLYLKYDKVKTLSRQELNAVSCEMLRDVDVVIHLAGKAHDLKKTVNPDEYYQVNFELTKKLYDVFLKSDVKKFIFMSSVKAAADSVEGILTEETIPNPLTDYGKSKLKAEQYILNQPIPDGKFYYILRPCMIHGPGNKGNLNLLYKVVQSGIPYPLAAFTNKRSFLSVDNLCFIIKNLIDQNNVTNGIYNISDDQALSTINVVSLLANSLGKNAILWRIPKPFIVSFAKIGDFFKMPLNSERLGKLTENYEVSNVKIIQELKIKLPLSASEGITLTALSFKN